MTLRILLVSLVAGMGFELPGGPEIAGWTRSGRDWVHARLADRPGPVAEADGPDAGPADCRPAEASAPAGPTAAVEVAGVPDDAAFLAASEAMAAGFLADSMSTRDELTPAEDATEVSSSEPTPAVGLPEGEAMTEVEGTDDVPTEATIETEPTPARADRVRSAIRLTREAVQAWAELIRESPDEAPATR